MTEISTDPGLENFINDWSSDAAGCRQVFLELKSHLDKYEDIALDFVPRPGVTYSLRASRLQQKKRPLFALIDVIDENPRWLSVCFYEDLVTDPEEFGDMVPQGLLGEDGYCFDVESRDPAFVQYLCRRIDEAYEKAAA
ncbi:MAG: hypothetical protein ACLFQ9_07045 [Desulfobacterales bacterium]